MDTQELLVHNRSQRQGTEGLHASLIYGFGVLVLALELEGEVVRQVTALVVSSEQPQCLGVVDLQRPEVQDTLDTEVATVDIVAQEKVSRLGRVAADLEELHEIIVLAVHVATDGYGGVHLQEVGLGTQQLCALPEDP